MTRLTGVPDTCPHCRQPTHGILLCKGCGNLTTEHPKADRRGYRQCQADGKGRDNSPKAIARRRTKMGA